MPLRSLTAAVLVTTLVLASLFAPGTLALHVPEDPETWSHHLETSEFESLVVAVDPAPDAQAFDVSLEFTASYPDSRVGIATSEVFEGSAANSIGFVRHIASQGFGDEFRVDVGPLTAGPEAWSAISDDEGSGNASGVGHTGVGLTPRTFEFNEDRDTVYFVLWAPSENTTADIYMDVPGETTVTTHAETGNVHLDTWRTFDPTAQAVSPAASAYVTEHSIHVEDNLLASYLHGTIIAPTAGHASYEIPTGCSLDKVFVGLFNAYREMNCPSPPAGYYEGWAFSESISSPYAGEWTFEGHHGGVHGSRSLALAWTDVELQAAAS